jgi:toxin ParE1/3/4
MAKVVWTPKALADLEELLDYISKDAPAAARRFGQKLIDRVESLVNSPFLGSFVPEDSNRVYRELRHGSYRLIYRTDGQGVYIVAIHHGARLLHMDDLA